ncbi:g8355 [Coccomyxa elongata]
MDYYRDPDSIEVAAAARPAPLALLAEQAARQPMPSTSPPTTADGILDAHLQPGTDAQSRPGTGRSTGGVRGRGQETIMQIKSRQDMELRAAGEASHRFRAHHLPRSTSEPRYARILEQQAERLQAYHEHSRQVLSQLEAPFSFYQRDKERAAALAAAVAAAAEREAGFQKPSFKAKPVPAFIRKRAQEFRLQRHERQALAVLQQVMQASSQNRHPALLGQPKRPQKLPHQHHRAEEQWLRGTMEQSLMAPSISSVMEEARRLEGRDARAVHCKRDGLVGTSSREGQAGLLANRSVMRQLPQPAGEGAGMDRPAVQAVAGSLVARSQNAAYKAGKVPNFAALHASWARRLAAAKAAVQRGLTVRKASRLTEKRPKVAPAGPVNDREDSCSFTGRTFEGRAKSHSGSHAGFQPGLARSCEDSFSELHSSAGIRRSASSAADLELWFAVQARLQRKAALLIEKISLVKQGCYSMMQHIGILD